MKRALDNFKNEEGQPKRPGSSSSDMRIARVRDWGLLADLQGIVHGIFGDDDWLEMERGDYHALVSAVQNRINREGFANRLALNLMDDLADETGSHDLMVQSSLYLRAARPGLGNESIGWHRESFYGGPPETVNVWLPILNVTEANSIRYVPGSAAIPDDGILVETYGDGAVERNSAGHSIGFLYAPKRIVSGVDFEAAVPLRINFGEAAIFSSMLIHGAAPNATGKIRFSVDFRVIARKHIVGQTAGIGVSKTYFVPVHA